MNIQGGIIIALILVLLWFFVIPKKEPNVRDDDLRKFYIVDSGKPGPCIGIITGVHGNERSGPIELGSLISSGDLQKRIKYGKLKIIPCANISGFKRDIRWRNLWFEDLNRLFNKSSDKQAKLILKFLDDCDLVLDFHEAWGWHLINPESTGNTLLPVGGCDSLVTDLVDAVNRNPTVAKINIRNPGKSFSVMEKYIMCKYAGTLSCWMHQHNRRYILAEIAGQNFVQPLEIRREIIRTIIWTLMDRYEM